MIITKAGNRDMYDYQNADINEEILESIHHDHQAYQKNQQNQAIKSNTNNGSTIAALIHPHQTNIRNQLNFTS